MSLVVVYDFVCGGLYWRRGEWVEWGSPSRRYRIAAGWVGCLMLVPEGALLDEGYHLAYPDEVSRLD